MSEVYIVLGMIAWWAVSGLVLYATTKQHAEVYVKRTYNYTTHEEDKKTMVASYHDLYDSFPIYLFGLGLFFSAYLLYIGWFKDPSINKALRKIARDERKNKRERKATAHRVQKQMVLQQKLKVIDSHN